MESVPEGTASGVAGAPVGDPEGEAAANVSNEYKK